MPVLKTFDPDPYRRRFTFPKWTRFVTVCDEPALFGMLPEFAGWRKADHVRRSDELMAAGKECADLRSAVIDAALEEYGSHGSLISGCVREHFPELVKDRLRSLAVAQNDAFDRSLAHWRKAGRRAETWRARYRAS